MGRQEPKHIQRKANKLRDQGFKVDVYHTGAGWRVAVVATKETAAMDETAAAALLPHLTTRYRAFQDLAQAHGLDLRTVVNGAWTLAKTQRAVATVTRGGYFGAIRKVY